MYIVALNAYIVIILFPIKKAILHLMENAHSKM